MYKRNGGLLSTSGREITALGRTGENEVTGKNIRYYSGVGEEFTKGNRKASMARLFVDDVMVYIEYGFFGG